MKIPIKYILTNLKLKTLLLVCVFSNASFATTYFVSPTGNDSGNGAVSSPFKTIAKGAAVAKAGDTILVSGGTYIEENISPGSSGIENAMIVFKPNPGTGDVIIKHPGTTIDDNNPVFSLSNNSYIWIEGFIFKDYSYGKAAIRISNGGNNVVINNRFENLGNEEVGSWDGNTIVWIGWTNSNVISNNYFINCFGDGIGYFGDGCKYNLISNNTLLDFKGKLRSWGGLYKYSAALGGGGDVPDGNNVFAFNYIKGGLHHIWLDRHGSDNVILRNFCNTGSNGIFNESRCANNIIQENICINMKAGFMSSYYAETGWTIEPRWINNVAYNNERGFDIHKSERDEFRNNIAYNNTNYNIIFTSEALSNAPHIFKNNLWYSDNKTNSIQFKGIAVSVPTFQSGVGEINGLSVNPMFTSLTPGAEDFTLQSSSPAKNAGDNGLDLGAYAIYPKTSIGWDTSVQTSGVLVYFDSLISLAERGTQVQFLLKLNKASSEQISVDIAPVAGDAVNGLDFILSDTSVTFQPGEISKSLSIEIADSSEHDELVAFQLTNIVNAQPGARNLRLVRIKKTPILTANAGVDQIIRDSDNDGSANALLDGSSSDDPDGTIISYIWTEGETQIATGEKPEVSLATGIHTITLTVTDNEGNTDTDEVIIKVVEDSGVWLEAECGTVGSLWNIGTDNNASNGEFVSIKSGNNSTSSAPTDATGLITFTFNINQSGTYTLFARLICPSPNDDSFWLKMDNESFIMWNDITPSSSWIWVSFSQTYSLNVGSHTFTIGYREDGAKLDKLWITNDVAELFDEGSAAGNCGSSVLNYETISNIDIYPNPVCEELNIILPDSPSMVSLYNSSGQELFSQNTQAANMTVNMVNYITGIYIVKITGQHQTIVKKIIKQ